MGRSPRLAGLAFLALAAPGCVSGHLLDAARRREEARSYRAACLDGDRLVLGYTGLATRDDGTPIGNVERWAAIPLAALARPRLASIEELPVEHLSSPPVCRMPLALVRDHEFPPGVPALEVDNPNGTDDVFVLRDGTGDHPPVPSEALTRVRTAPWVYPLLPFTAAFDAVTNPVLLFFAPAVIVVGD